MKRLLASLLGLASACAGDSQRELALYEKKSASRADQSELSSHAECYCFPTGQVCHYGPLESGPAQAPQDLPQCVEGEACYASSGWYSMGFDNPQGRCLRLCFHAGQRLTPDVAVEPFSRYLKMDCATGEECVLAEIDVNFEGYPRAIVGMCIRPPPDGTIIIY